MFSGLVEVLKIRSLQLFIKLCNPAELFTLGYKFLNVKFVKNHTYRVLRLSVLNIK